MFKLYKKFKAIDWLSVALIIGLTVLQVFFTMILIAYAVRLLFSFYESYFPEKEKKTALLAILLLAFINPYFSIACLVPGISPSSYPKQPNS